MKTSESIKELTGALLKFQGEVKGIAKDGKGYNYSYITLDQILELIRPKLVESDITLIQEVHSRILDSGKIVDAVITRLNHISGEYMETEPLYIEATATPKKDGTIPPVTPQEHGSAITYAKRYQLSALLALNADVDDDANQYKQSKTTVNAKNWGAKVTDDQIKILGDLIKAKGLGANDMQPLMLKTIKTVKSSADLTPQEADVLIAALSAMPDKLV